MHVSFLPYWPFRYKINRRKSITASKYYAEHVDVDVLTYTSITDKYKEAGKEGFSSIGQ